MGPALAHTDCQVLAGPWECRSSNLGSREPPWRAPHLQVADLLSWEKARQSRCLTGPVRRSIMSVLMMKYRRSGARPKPAIRAAEAKVLTLARKAGVLRPRDLVTYGIPRVVLSRLRLREVLKRVGRGLYVLPGSDLSEHHTLAEACKRVPHGVVCLLSALSFHGLTTQSPFEVWMAIDFKARKPRVETPPLRIVRFSGHALTYGVEQRRVEGVPVRVTSLAKTVADCFKYRNKIGLDVALEALREYRRKRKSLDLLWRAAEVCRVASVIRPYLEALA